MKWRLECQNGALYFCKFCFPCGCASAQCVPDAKWLSCLRCFHVMLSIVYDTCLFCFSISKRPPAYFVWRFRYRNKTRNKKNSPFSFKRSTIGHPSIVHRRRNIDGAVPLNP
ncbi:unnamed protein product [Ixodes pacificus]